MHKPNNTVLKKFALSQAVLLLPWLCILSCNSDYSVSKKRGYFRIDFPEKQYRVFDQPGYPYTFEYPVYSTVNRDSTFFEDEAEDWWVNIDIPRFAGRIYMSYKSIGKGINDFDSLVNDAFTMAYKKHVDISSGIGEKKIETSQGGGIYFRLGGNTATANQFFITDSSRHFLRGALYFDAAPNADSLSIVNDFLRKDLEHLINSLRWK
jgi:gliding motility-associated lipoprotein GldD